MMIVDTKLFLLFESITTYVLVPAGGRRTHTAEKML